MKHLSTLLSTSNFFFLSPSFLFHSLETQGEHLLAQYQSVMMHDACMSTFKKSRNDQFICNQLKHQSIFICMPKLNSYVFIYIYIYIYIYMNQTTAAVHTTITSHVKYFTHQK